MLYDIIFKAFITGVAYLIASIILIYLIRSQCKVRRNIYKMEEHFSLNTFFFPIRKLNLV